MAASSVDATSDSELEALKHLTDAADIEKALEKLNKQEDDVNTELGFLLEKQAHLEDKMVSLHRTLPNLQKLETDSKQLSSMVSFTSTLAENVSSKVRQLDLAKSRVTSCIERVEDILDLKYCTDGVQQALQNEDYEKAASHIHRFRNLDENVLRMSDIASEGSSLDTSFRLLHESEEKLRVIVSNKFDASVHSGDVASIQRFFKIFPLLGQHEEDEADKTLRLALHGTDPDDKRAKVLFADTITKLFEQIAKALEIHQALVESYYEKCDEVEGFIQNCDTSRLMQELICSYITMEEFFMREMVLKAVVMDSIESGSHTSSMVDDAFFIVKKCVRRAMSSSSVDGVCAMLNHACTILEQDFREVLFGRVRAGFPSGFDLSQAYNMVQSSIQQGKLQASDTEKAKTQFITTVNNAEVSCDYCKQLKTSLEDEVSKFYSQGSQQSKNKLESCLSDIGSAAAKFKDVVEFGFSQLTTAVIKPRIKPQIDIFLSDDYSNFEANDPWVQNFIVAVDTVLGNFKESLTSNNYEKFVSLIMNEITTTLEKAVLKTSFNRLGGLQFDKELRQLTGYLTSVTTWTIRDKFARLTQMATILNLERVDELLDYWGPNSGPMTWRLTPSEVRQVLSLRIDFRTDDIKRLKL
ncbi:COG4-like protein [Mya arenaria]|uniref:Conserved oligomeric Golgi complex subunit 4 n=1 Tax=Mya arenaria TaxID=6604 RepID=A0ABY7EUK2_MYAAR|nr:COG4-like protein [Mya arenaria]